MAVKRTVTLAQLRADGLAMLGSTVDTSHLIEWFGQVAEALEPYGLRYAVPIDMDTQAIIALRIGQLFRADGHPIPE